MARYIECETACAEIDKGDLLVGNNAEFAKEIIRRTPTADVAPRSEVAREIFGEIEAEIVAALESNYSARTTRMKKSTVEYSAEYISYFDGKIHALRGIADFVEEIKQKYTEE